jgi:hypothetical protein
MGECARRKRDHEEQRERKVVEMEKVLEKEYTRKG